MQLQFRLSSSQDGDTGPEAGCVFKDYLDRFKTVDVFEFSGAGQIAGFFHAALLFFLVWSLEN